jgi:RimJ/RimL family protein N-acetyltransferase
MIMKVPCCTLPIDTERLRLRLPEERDRPAYFELHTDPDYVNFIGSPIDADRFAKQFADALGPDPEHRSIAIELKQTGVVVGELVLVASSPGEVELVVAIRESCRRNGYSSEAAKALINALFSDAAAKSIMVCVEEDNDASLRLVQNLAMRRVGRTLRSGNKNPTVFTLEAPRAGV